MYLRICTLYSRTRFDDEKRNCFGMRRYTALRKQVVMLLIVKRKRLGVRINEQFIPPLPPHHLIPPLYRYHILSIYLSLWYSTVNGVKSFCVLSCLEV